MEEVGGRKEREIETEMCERYIEALPPTVPQPGPGLPLQLRSVPLTRMEPGSLQLAADALTTEPNGQGHQATFREKYVGMCLQLCACTKIQLYIYTV